MRGNLDQDRAIDEIWVGPITSRVAYDVVPFPPRLSGQILDGAKVVSKFEGQIGGRISVLETS